MPQGWLKNWALPDGSKGMDLLELFNASETDKRAVATRKRDTAVQTLGNLTILSTGLNSSQSNLPWKQKRPEMMKHSLLPINQELLETLEWNEAAILKRGESLFTRHWRFGSGSLSQSLRVVATQRPSCSMLDACSFADLPPHHFSPICATVTGRRPRRAMANIHRGRASCVSIIVSGLQDGLPPACAGSLGFGTPRSWFAWPGPFG